MEHRRRGRRGGLVAERERNRLDHAVWPLGIGVAYTFAAVGHATTTPPAWLSIGADAALGVTVVGNARRAKAAGAPA